MQNENMATISGQYGKVYIGEFNADMRWQVAIKTMKGETQIIMWVTQLRNT